MIIININSLLIYILLLITYSSAQTGWRYLGGTYNTESTNYTSNPPLFGGNDYLTGTIYDNKLWWFGGGSDLNGLWMYDIATETTTVLREHIANSNAQLFTNDTRGELYPGGRYGNCIWGYNGGIYIYGGENSNYYGDVWRYNIAGDSWNPLVSDSDGSFEDINSCTETITHPGCRGYVNGRIIGSDYYVYGGHDTNGLSTTLWKFNCINNSWNIVSNFSSAVRYEYGMGADIVNKLLYMAFGYNSDYANDVWTFDISSDTWVEHFTQGHGNFSGREYTRSAVDYFGRLYNFGGYSGDYHSSFIQVDIVTDSYIKFGFNQTVGEFPAGPNIDLTYPGGCESGFLEFDSFNNAYVMCKYDSDGSQGNYWTYGCQDICNGEYLCLIETLECVCKDNYFGINCELCTCENNDCNDGLAGNGSCNCNINSGFFGENCTSCACGNASCADGQAGDGSCFCSQDYFGIDCENCECVNGICSDGLLGDGTCNCTGTGFTGTLCDIAITADESNSSSDDDTINGSNTDNNSGSGTDNSTDENSTQEQSSSVIVLISVMVTLVSIII